jgi:hypothetical protein
VPHEDDLGTYMLGFERDGLHYLLASSAGRDRGALFRVNAATGKRDLLAEHPKADLLGVIRDPRSAQRSRSRGQIRVSAAGMGRDRPRYRR